MSIKKKKIKPIIFKTKIFKTLKKPDSRDKVIAAILHIDEIILQTLNFEKLTEKIVNIILEELGYLQLGYVMIVLSLIDRRNKRLKRVSISHTKEAKKVLQISPIPLKDIEFSLNELGNYCIKAIKNNKAYITNDLSNMLYPAIKRSFVKKVQKNLGIKTSIVLPIISRNKPIGSIIFTLKKREKEISIFERQVLIGFSNAVGIAVEHASLLHRLKKTNKRLKQVSALKDEFVSLTSHELRTPLTAVSGSISTILEGYAGKVDKEAKEFLQGALNESNRLIRLVNNLLNISRIEAGRLKFDITEFNLTDLISEVGENLRGQAKEKKLALKFSFPQKLIVKGDKDKVREVLINLIGNALKYTDQGWVAVTASSQDSLALVAIEDSGRGVLPQDQKKLFHKFERVNGVKRAERKGGTGLGLYICKNLIEHMEGEVWLKSQHQKGSTFYFTLPLS